MTQATRRRVEITTPPPKADSDSSSLSVLSVVKALDGRPRPQKQLSQPTLGASEHMEAGRLRGSQSSEGSELVHSTSVNTSSPNSATYSSDTSRDTDMGRPSFITIRYYIDSVGTDYMFVNIIDSISHADLHPILNL